MAKQKRKTKKSQKKIPWLWIGLGIVAIVIAAGFILGRSTSETITALPDSISIEQAHEKYEQGAFILDVRTPEEWNTIHIPNTTSIPLEELGNRIDELPKDQEIIVICRSGNRSQQGRNILQQAGFERVTSMIGGISAWSANGYPVE